MSLPIPLSKTDCPLRSVDALRAWIEDTAQSQSAVVPVVPAPTVQVELTMLRRAAWVIAQEYAGRIESRPAHLLRWKGLRVQLMPDPRSGGQLVAIIRGSDDMTDWLNNFKVFTREQLEYGESSRQYAGGLLEDARIAYAYCKGAGVAAVLGHSRGAALAAIVGWSLDVPVFAFGCPRYVMHVRKRGSGPDGPVPFTVSDARVVFVTRRDDLVTSLAPKFVALRRCGIEITLAPPRHAGEDHRIEHYIEALDAAYDGLSARMPDPFLPGTFGWH